MSWSPQQEQAIKSVKAWLANKNGQQVFRLFGYAGSGKAQPLSSIVQTPYGPRHMGEIRVGDYVIGRNGNPVAVTGVFPQGVKPVYKVSFRDGSYTRCCGDHLWAVTNGRDELRKKKHRILTTEQIIKIGIRYPSDDCRFRIPLCEPVNFDRSHPPVDPYTIGALIGDGSLKGNTVDFACKDREIIERITKALPIGMAVVDRMCGNCPHYVLKDETGAHHNRLKSHLERLGLRVGSHDKFIPEEYLFAPVEDRIDLLRGLMDTDGSITNNRSNFSTTSGQLAKDIVHLVQSLGGTAIIRKYERVDKKSTEYDINIKSTVNPFYLERKASRWSFSEKNPPSRFITSIESDGSEEQQCIAVDADDHLYLTDNFIVTHNTTLARELASEVKGNVLFACFTGKASLVLRKKGCHNASTIHSLIYKAVQNEVTGEYEFKLNDDSAAAMASLIVIDEVSMVGEDLAKDLLSFGVKVLVLGDPAQLPPVKGEGFFINAQPDVMLTEVHRQAAENPIIRLSMDVREGRRLVPGTYGDTRVILRATADRDELRSLALKADQILCGLNKTRQTYNMRIRDLKGIAGHAEPWHPAVTDRLVCLRNNREKGLLNGGLWEAQDVTMKASYSELRVQSLDEPEMSPVDVSVLLPFFNGTEKDLDWKVKKGFEEFTYGYALTVHKSQGSQFDDVLLFDESYVFKQDAAKHLYTGITRAAERLTVVV